MRDCFSDWIFYLDTSSNLKDLFFFVFLSSCSKKNKKKNKKKQKINFSARIRVEHVWNRVESNNRQLCTIFRHMVETHHETKLKLYDNWLCTAKKCVDFYCTGLFRKYGQNWSIREGGGTLAISITQACGASIMLSVDEEEIESTGKKYDKVFWKFLNWGGKSCFISCHLQVSVQLCGYPRTCLPRENCW